MENHRFQRMESVLGEVVLWHLVFPSLCSDRFRTMINVLGDGLAAGIIAHLCRKDFPLSKAGKVKTAIDYSW